MTKLSLKGKDIYIVDSHHQVLEAWESVPHQNVFTMDYHTDTREAFHSYSYWRSHSEVKAGKCQDQGKRIAELTNQKINDYLENKTTIKQINDNLKHDEHLDFAVRTKLIHSAFVLATSRNETSSNPRVHVVHGSQEFQNQKILEFSPLCIPLCQRSTHHEDCIRLKADSVLENVVLDEAIRMVESLIPSFFSHYILDIDCDYFNTGESLSPKESSTFKTLVKGASIITIARERACVKICRLKDSVVTSEFILEQLLSLIEE